MLARHFSTPASRRVFIAPPPTSMVARKATNVHLKQSVRGFWFFGTSVAVWPTLDNRYIQPYITVTSAVDV